MAEDSNLDKIQEPIVNATPEIRQILEQVLQLEKDKLYQKAPKNINEDILQIIKKAIL